MSEGEILPTSTSDQRRLLDELDVERTLNLYAWAVDTRDWPLFGSLFDNEIYVDFETLNGAPPRVRARADWVADLDWLFAGVDATQHCLSNFRCEFSPDGSEAETVAYLHAQHVTTLNGAPNLYTVGGYYTDRLRRSSDGWRITSVRFERMWVSGNTALLEIARNRPGRPTDRT